MRQAAGYVDRLGKVLGGGEGLGKGMTVQFNTNFKFYDKNASVSFLSVYELSLNSEVVESMLLPFQLFPPFSSLGGWGWSWAKCRFTRNLTEVSYL